MKVKKKYLLIAAEKTAVLREVNENVPDEGCEREELELLLFPQYRHWHCKYIYDIWDKAKELQDQAQQGSQDELSDDDYKRIKKKADIAVRFSRIERLLNELKQLTNETSTSN